MSPVRPRVLVYAQDAGGARAIAPVVERLVDSGLWETQVLAHLFAVGIFRESGISAEELRVVAGGVPLTEGDARRLLSNFSPDALFCTTSNNLFDPSNGVLVAAARELAIPSLGLMDHWKGWSRFHEKNRDFGFLPNRLGVIDEWSVVRGTREGIAPGRMVAVGHPRLESLFRSAEGLPRRPEGWREFSSSEFVCTLFTQPVAGLREEEEAVLRPLLEEGRSETIRKVFRRCAAYAERTGRKGRFMVCLHPREQAMAEVGMSLLGEAVADSRSSALELAFSSHAVFGIDSMILFEAMFSGVPAAGLRIGSLAGLSAVGDLPDILPCVQTLDELDAWLERNEGRGPLFAGSYPLPRDAAGTCIRLLEQMTSPLRGAGRIVQEARE